MQPKHQSPLRSPLIRKLARLKPPAGTEGSVGGLKPARRGIRAVGDAEGGTGAPIST